MSDDKQTKTLKRCVASPQMITLRRTQERLNRYCRATEIAYRYIGSRLPEETAGPALSAFEVLRALPAHAWYATRDGKPHYDFTLGDLLADVERGLDLTYRTTIIYFCAEFDAYLDYRLSPILNEENALRERNGQRPKKEPSPYLLRLDRAKIAEHPCRPSSTVILRGDLCRCLRNIIVHEPEKLPQSVDDDVIRNFLDAAVEWRERVKLRPPHQSSSREGIRRRVLEYMIQHAKDRREEAIRCDIPVPPFEYLYAIFVFGNLSRLAVHLDQVFMSEEEVAECVVAYRRKEVSAAKEIQAPADNILALENVR